MASSLYTDDTTIRVLLTAEATREAPMRLLHLVRRVSVVALVSAALAMVGMVASGPAEASGGTVTCSTVTGNQYAPVQMYSCSQITATGGAATIQPAPIFVAGEHTGTIYWSAATMTQPAKTVVRLRVRLIKKKKTPCSASGATEIRVGGIVRSDTSGAVTVGGTVGGILCQASNGSFTLLPGTSFVIGG